MIIHLKAEIQTAEAEEIAIAAKASIHFDGNRYVLVTSSGMKQLPESLIPKVEKHWVFPDDMQLASRNYLGETRRIPLGNGLEIGGDSQNSMVITGPCSVESREQIEQMAQLCVELGIGVLRGGAFKPRTSPYSFQGMGIDGLKLLAEMRDKYGLSIISEVRDASHVEVVIQYADIIQIGAKAMYDHGILRACGAAGKPVLIKRGFGSTLQEFVQAAEFVLSGGNPHVILCERGIRTFETKTRFTLDLCGVAWLKAHTNLPVIVDPSHAMGHAYGVPDLSRAAMAMGVDGLLIETHPDPRVAKSDASQQLDPDTFRALFHTLSPIAKAIGKKVV